MIWMLIVIWTLVGIHVMMRRKNPEIYFLEYIVFAPAVFVFFLIGLFFGDAD